MDIILSHPVWSYLISACYQVERLGSSKISKEEGLLRWNIYAEANKVHRSHTVGQHLISTNAVVEPTIVTWLKDEKDLPINALLISRLNSNHDTGELEHFDSGNNHDKVSQLKDKDDDLREYMKFVEIHENAPAPVWNELHRSYLLQFAVDCPESFPETAQAIMRELQNKYSLEIKVFEAIERVGHVVYASEQYFHGKAVNVDHQQILVDTLNFQGPHLDRLASKIPGLADLLWSPDISQACIDYVRNMAADYPNFLEHNAEVWVPEQCPNALRY